MDKDKTDEMKIKWISFVPQIGGSAIGCKKATGVSPITTLSYSAFDKNDRHLRAYWDKVPHLNMDKEEDVRDFRRLCAGQEIDFVTTICPCAGLSRLGKSRGSDAEQNYWMMEAALKDK